MKAITLTQPWATLVAIGAKRIETRSWQTSYRGPLAIHAGKGLGDMSPSHLISLLNKDPFRSALSGSGFERLNSLPRGCIIARGELIDCIPTHFITQQVAAHYRYRVEWQGKEFDFVKVDEAEREIAFGDYTPGRYAWLLADVRMLPEPISVRGALGLWDWSER